MEFNMYKNNKEINYVCYENAIILPRKLINNSPGWGLGGICDKNNKFIEESCYHGGWINQGGYYDWKDEKYIDENVVYIGLFFKHWGHFLVDLSLRLWIFANSDFSKSDVKIAYIGEEEPDGNYLEFFNLLGISKEQLIKISVPTRFKKVILPENACRPCIWYSTEYQNMFNYIIKNACKQIKSINGVTNFDKVYFTRINLVKAKISEIGEIFFINFFKVNNFHVFEPENLTLSQQIYVWNHSNHIFCINGSIPINVVFSNNKKLKLTILNKTSILHKNIYLYLLMKNVDYNEIDIYQEPLKKYPKSLGEGPFLLDITRKFKDYAIANRFDYPYSCLQDKIIRIKSYILYFILISKISFFIKRIYRKLKRYINCKQ